MCDLFLDLLIMRFTPKYVSSWASGPLIGPLESGWDLQSLESIRVDFIQYFRAEVLYMENPVIIHTLSFFLSGQAFPQ